MNVIEALVHELKKGHPHLSPALEKAKPFLAEAQKGRNRVVHGQWSNHPDLGVVKIKSSARGRLKYGVDTVSLDELKAASIAIGNAGLAIFKMILGE